MYVYKISFKGRGESDLYMPAHIVEREGLLSKFMKTEDVVSFGDQMFRCSDIRRVSREWQTDYKAEEPQAAEIPDEVREKNQRRLRWIKTYLATYRLGRTTKERLRAAFPQIPTKEREGYRQFVRWYHSAEQEKRRAQRDEFRRAHFDVYYPTHEAFHKAFESWVAESRQISLVDAAEQIFGSQTA